MCDPVDEAVTAYNGHNPNVPESLFASSSRERRLLLSVQSIAVGPVRKVSGLDWANRAIVLATVSHARGSQEHRDFCQQNGAVHAANRLEDCMENPVPLSDWPVAR